jgi:hypothetical protein
VTYKEKQHTHRTSVNLNKNVPDSVSLANEKYPETMEWYREIMWQQHDLFCKKMLDYGADNISLGSDLKSAESRKVSITGIWFRCNDKIQRLKNLVVLGNNQQVESEGITDTLQDLSVYAIIAQIVGAGKWGR